MFTRETLCSGIKQDEAIHSELAKTNLTYRATCEWNELPLEVRQAPKLGGFKKIIKKWILVHIPLD